MSARTDLYTPAQMKIVRKMADAGETATKIGNIVGRSKSSVIAKCRRDGIKLRFKRIYGKQTKQVKKKKKPVFNIKISPDILIKPFDENPETAVHLINTLEHHCRWPLLNGLYCGAHAEEKLSYCEKHHAVAHYGKGQDFLPLTG